MQVGVLSLGLGNNFAPGDPAAATRLDNSLAQTLIKTAIAGLLPPQPTSSPHCNIWQICCRKGTCREVEFFFQMGIQIKH